MGYTGAGFAQGFAQTLNTLGPIIQRNQQEREQLELQKKLATASLAKHEAETSILTQKLTRDQGFRALLLNGVPGQPTQQFDDMGLSLGQQPGPRTPFNVANPQHRMLLGAIDPDFLKEDIKSQIKTQAGVDAMARLPQVLAQARNAGVPGLAAAPGQPRGMDVGAGSDVPAQPGAAPLPQITSPETSVTFDPADGSMKLTFRDSPVKWEVKDGVAEVNGNFQMVRDFINPMNGQQHRVLQGPPLPPESVQRLSLIADSYGLKRGSPAHAAAVSELAAATALPGELQAHSLASLEAKYKQVATQAGAASSNGALSSAATAPAPAQTGAAGAIASKQSADVIQKARETAATIQAKLQNEPLEGVSRDKFLAQEAVQRKGVRALELLRPEFVGKPFIDKFKAEFAAAEKLKEYTPGYLAGAMREFFGNASPAEVEFRRTVLEMADDVLRARSGAAISPQEYGRIAGFIANLSDEPAVFKTAMERIVSEASRMMEATVKVATTPASKLNTTKPSASEPARKPNFRFDPKTNRLIPVGP